MPTNFATNFLGCASDQPVVGLSVGTDLEDGGNLAISTLPLQPVRPISSPWTPSRWDMAAAHGGVDDFIAGIKLLQQGTMSSSPRRRGRGFPVRRTQNSSLV